MINLKRFSLFTRFHWDEISFQDELISVKPQGLNFIWEGKGKEVNKKW